MKNKGFSLVELIVVIAIMAILVGVAVPVYSSYIEKAQKAKDEQMVGEIIHAIEITAAGENWAAQYEIVQDRTYLGSIVLHHNANAEVDSEDAFGTALENALAQIFGTGYESQFTLSYGEWKGTLSGGNATYIVNSGYYGKTDDLIGKVQGLTNTLKDFVSSNPEKNVGAGFQSFLETELGVIDPTADDYAQKVANAATLYVSQRTDGVDAVKFQTLWTGSDGSLMLDGADGGNHEVFDGLFPALAAEYARMVARVNYSGSAKLQEFLDPSVLNGANANAVMQKFQGQLGLIEQALNDGTSVTEEEKSRYRAYPGTEVAVNDAKAYLAILDQVGDAKDVVSSNLSSGEIYNESDVLSYVNNYLTAADLLSRANAVDGDVVILFTIDKSGKIHADCYPINF